MTTDVGHGVRPACSSCKHSGGLLGQRTSIVIPIAYKMGAIVDVNYFVGAIDRLESAGIAPGGPKHQEYPLARSGGYHATAGSSPPTAGPRFAVERIRKMVLSSARNDQLVPHLWLA